LLTEGEYRLSETTVSNWALFGRGRIAWLLGPWEEPASGAGRNGDGTMTIAEGALGIAYRRRLRRADLFVQCALEAQSWNIVIADSINLMGVTSGIGATW
jgi:hypothetical protein